jgi:hypothetical protein
MIPAPYRLVVLEAGKLKLAAKARLAEGGQVAPYEAAVLYHAAARAEQRALLARELPSPEARLASAIERCASLILGFDATAVLDVGWADVLVASAAVEEKTAAAMRTRIDEMMSSFIEKYRKVVEKKPAFDVSRETRRLVGSPRSVRLALDRCLKAFPDDAFMWALRSSSYFEDGDVAAAWEAIRRARELMPEETSFVGWEIRLVAKHLPTAQAEARLAGAHAEIERGEASADVCGGFIVAAMDLVPKSAHRAELLGQAIHAAREGVRAAPRQSEEQKVFRAMELGLREMLAGGSRGCRSCIAAASEAWPPRRPSRRIGWGSCWRGRYRSGGWRLEGSAAAAPVRRARTGLIMMRRGDASRAIDECGVNGGAAQASDHLR